MKAFAVRSSITIAGPRSNANLPSIPKTDRARATPLTPCLQANSLMIVGTK
jgi:hypothetical protein